MLSPIRLIVCLVLVPRIAVRMNLVLVPLWGRIKTMWGGGGEGGTGTDALEGGVDAEGFIRSPKGRLGKVEVGKIA